MTERVSSDHDAVESHRVHLDPVGRTSRVQLPLPEDLDPAVDDVVCLCFDGSVFYAQVETTLDGQPAIRRAAADQQLARTGDCEDALAAWLSDAGLSSGDPLLLDVLTPGWAYGLRLPGERVVYSPPEQPDDSLASIARDLDEE